MDKGDVVHIYNGILFSHKKNKTISLTATQVDPEIVILNEVSQTEKDKSYNITYMWNLKKWLKWTYLQKRNRFIDTEYKCVVYWREQMGGNVEWRLGLAGFSRCKLLYMEWISNKVLLYSTENYMPYPMINNGMNILKCIYVYNWIPFLYSRNQYNFINQVYFNQNKLKLYAVMEMKFESIIIIISEKAQHKWLRILWFLLYEIFRIGKLIESECKLFIDRS